MMSLYKTGYSLISSSLSPGRGLFIGEQRGETEHSAAEELACKFCTGSNGGTQKSNVADPK